jgi:hypothetical protein
VPDSPLAASPYAVLGVTAQASAAELKRAFRRRLRETHPDTGGDPAVFVRVQLAWEQVGTPEARAAYDSGSRRVDDEGGRTWAPAPPRKRENASRPQARTHGHPGGWYRERYLELLREWVGRGADIPDPYDAALVRSAPVEVRHLLAAAIAEEQSAVVLAGLGMGFTVWHDVDTGAGKIDHIALGPSGLWGILSEDWGSEVSVRRGELVGAGIPRDDRPVQYLARTTRDFEKAARVKFSALLVVVGDGQSADGVEAIGKVRSARAFLVQRPRLAHLVRTGIEGIGTGGTDLFEVRTRVQGAARFV